MTTRQETRSWNSKFRQRIHRLTNPINKKTCAPAILMQMLKRVRASMGSVPRSTTSIQASAHNAVGPTIAPNKARNIRAFLGRHSFACGCVEAALSAYFILAAPLLLLRALSSRPSSVEIPAIAAPILAAIEDHSIALIDVPLILLVAFSFYRKRGLSAS